MDDGFLVVDKPLGLSSRQLLDRIKPHTRKKLGHTGTLDPMATGMMVVAIGEATKFSRFVLSQNKAYQATIQLGSQTTTDDIEGDIIATSDEIPSITDIKASLTAFTGNILQTPPKYSAVHVNGQRAYQLARKDIQVELPQRMITIHEITLLDYNPKTRQLKLYIHCQSGTYIRSIARDIGIALGTYGHLSQLRRLFISPFEHETSWRLEDLPKPTISLDKFFLNDKVELTHTQSLNLAYGKPIQLDGDKTFAAYYQDLFIGIIEPHQGYYRAVKLRSNIREKLGG